MDKICSGCGNRVAKPIFCSGCNTYSHPGCLSRTCHSFSDGKITDCPKSIPPAIPLNDSVIEKIGDILYAKIKEELQRFKVDIMETYRADMEKWRLELSSISDRVTVLEGKINSTISQSCSANVNLHAEEEILAEISERERRASNVILFNIEEPDPSSTHFGESVNDLNVVLDVLQVIKPSGFSIQKTARIGRKIPGRSRPVCVTLASKHEAMSIIRNKSAYKGPIKVSLDQTVKQRNYLKKLQNELKSLVDSGVTNKTIRYSNGVPKIVNINSSLSQKN